MSQAHVWACGQCGARVVARVGVIARTFKAHLVTCPALQRPGATAPRRARAPRALRAGRRGADTTSDPSA